MQGYEMTNAGVGNDQRLGTKWPKMRGNRYETSWCRKSYHENGTILILCVGNNMDYGYGHKITRLTVFTIKYDEWSRVIVTVTMQSKSCEFIFMNHWRGKILKLKMCRGNGWQESTESQFVFWSATLVNWECGWLLLYRDFRQMTWNNSEQWFQCGLQLWITTIILTFTDRLHWSVLAATVLLNIKWNSCVASIDSST